jgi:hypothetical protein
MVSYDWGDRKGNSKYLRRSPTFSCFALDYTLFVRRNTDGDFVSSYRPAVLNFVRPAARHINCQYWPLALFFINGLFEVGRVFQLTKQCVFF